MSLLRRAAFRRRGKSVAYLPGDRRQHGEDVLVLCARGDSERMIYGPTSNGLVRRVTANFIRTKAPNSRGCVELWVTPKSKPSAAAYEDPGVPDEAYGDTTFSGCLNTFGSQEFTKTGYSRTGTSWCDGHVGGGSDDDITLIKGRCRYRWVRR